MGVYREYLKKWWSADGGARPKSSDRSRGRDIYWTGMKRATIGSTTGSRKGRRDLQVSTQVRVRKQRASDGVEDAPTFDREIDCHCQFGAQNVDTRKSKETVRDHPK